MVTANIISPDGKHELGVVYDKGQLYAGYISNSGVSKEWVIDYDKDFTFDENLQCLYEIIDKEWQR